MSDRAWCAHMRVTYRTGESRPGLVVRGSWGCTECPNTFAPVPREKHAGSLLAWAVQVEGALIAACEQAGARIRALVARWSDGAPTEATLTEAERER